MIKADEVGNLTNTITSQADQPSSTNNPNPNTKTLTIPLGSSVNLSWGASGSANINYSTCLASSTPSSPWDNNWALGNAWTGAVIPVLGGPVNSTPSTNTLYKISCNDVNGVLVSSSIKVVTIDCSTDPSNPVCVTKSGLWDLGSPAHSTCDRDKNGDFITKLKFAISPWNPGYNCTLVSTDMNNQTSSTSSIVTVPNPPTNTSSPYTIPYNIVVPYPVTNFSLSCMHNPAGKTDPVIAVGKDTVSQCKPYVGLSVPACVKPKPDNNATVSWSTSLMSSCKITSPGNPDFIIPTGDIAADSTFPPLSVQPPSTVFTLECMGLDNLWHTYQSPAVLVDANCDKTIPPKKPPHFIER